MLAYIESAALGYIIGNIQFAVIFSHLLHRDDVRHHGSGNAGSTNMLRVYGKKDGIITFAGDLLKGVTQEADVIVANILADILIHLTEDAYRLVKDEGYLIMSGIISEKWDMVREWAEKAGFLLETHMVQGEWNACVFKKTDDISGVIGG